MTLTTDLHLTPRLQKYDSYTYTRLCPLLTFIERHLPLWVYIYLFTYLFIIHIYRVSHELRSLLRESVPYVKIYRYNPKHLCPKLNGFGDIGKRKVWTSWGCTHYTSSAGWHVTTISMSLRAESRHAVGVVSALSAYRRMLISPCWCVPKNGRVESTRWTASWKKS